MQMDIKIDGVTREVMQKALAQAKEARLHILDKMNEAMREKGVDFDLRNMKPEDLEELINALSDLEVDVDGKTKVRVFAE